MPDFAAMADRLLAGQNASSDLPALVDKYADKHGIPAPIFHGLVEQESGGNPNARPIDPKTGKPLSSAVGLTQVLKGALADYNKQHGTAYTSNDLTDPEKSLDVGGWYLATRPGDDWDQKLSTYYAGTEGIKKPALAKEAGNYVRGIQRRAQRYAGRGILPKEPDFAAMADRLLGTQDTKLASVGYPSEAFSEEEPAPDFAGMADRLLPAAPAATPKPGMDPKIQQQMDWSKDTIRSGVQMAREARDRPLDVPGYGQMTPDQLSAGLNDGTIQLSKGEINKLKNEIAIDVETAKYVIENEMDTARNYGRVNALSPQTGVPIVADAPPPLQEDPIQWGSFQKIMYALGVPQSMIVGPIAKKIENPDASAKDLWDEFTAPVEGKQLNSWRRVLDAIWPDKDFGTFDPFESLAAPQNKYIREAGLRPDPSNLSFTGKGATSLLADAVLDPLNFVHVGVPTNAIHLADGLVLSEKGKTLLAEGIKSGAPRSLMEATLRNMVDTGDMSVVAKGGVRIAGRSLPMTHEAGQLVREGARKAAQQVRKTSAGRFVADEANKLMAKFDRDWLVRPYFSYIRDKQGYFNAIKAERQQLLNEAQVIFHPLNKAQREAVTDAVEAGTIDAPTWTTLGERYEPQPGRIAYRTQEITPTDEMRTAARKVVEYQTGLRQAENELGIGGGFLENYMMRRWDNYPSVRELAQSRFGTQMTSNKAKPLADFTTLEMAELVPELVPATRDAMELMLMRGMSSVRAQQAFHFIEKTLKKYGKDFNQSGDWFQDLGQALREGYTVAPRIVNTRREELTRGLTDTGELADGVLPAPEPKPAPKPPKPEVHAPSQTSPSEMKAAKDRIREAGPLHVTVEDFTDEPVQGITQAERDEFWKKWDKGEVGERPVSDVVQESKVGDLTLESRTYAEPWDITRHSDNTLNKAAQKAEEDAISPALKPKLVASTDNDLSGKTLADPGLPGPEDYEHYGDNFGGMDLEESAPPAGFPPNRPPEGPPPVGLPPNVGPKGFGGDQFPANMPNEIDNAKKALRWMLPKAIAEDMLTVADPAEASALWRGYDRVTAAVKTSLTIPFPAFHVRNGIGNVANSFLDMGIQALNPRRHLQAMDVMRGKGGRFLTETGEEFTYDELRNAFRREGLEGAFHGRLDLIQTPEGQILGANAPKFWQSAGRVAAGKDSIRNLQPIKRFGQWAGENIEGEARMHLFLANIRRGDSIEAAARKVKQTLFDYDNLSTFEKRWMRRAIPFYSWTRKNVPFQVRMAIQHPGRAQALMEAYTMYGDQNMIEQQMRDLPPHMSHQIGRQIGQDAEGNPLFAISLGLPIEDLARIFPTVRSTESRSGEFLRMNFLSMMHPLFRAVIEEAANKDMYLDRPLDELNQMYSIWGKALEQTPKVVQDSVGFKKELNGRGDVVYKMNPRALHLVRGLVLSRIYSTTGKAFDERKDWATRALNALTGVTISSVDLETQILPAYRNRSWERKQASEAELKQQKYAKMFTDPFAGPSVSANELIGKPEPVTGKEAVSRTPDLSSQLQRGQITATEMADIAKQAAAK